MDRTGNFIYVLKSMVEAGEIESKSIHEVEDIIMQLENELINITHLYRQRVECSKEVEEVLKEAFERASNLQLWCSTCSDTKPILIKTHKNIYKLKGEQIVIPEERLAICRYCGTELPYEDLEIKTIKWLMRVYEERTGEPITVAEILADFENQSKKEYQSEDKEEVEVINTEKHYLVCVYDGDSNYDWNQMNESELMDYIHMHSYLFLDKDGNLNDNHIKVFEVDDRKGKTWYKLNKDL